MNIYSSILEKKAEGKKQFALLIDPDKLNPSDTLSIIDKAQRAEVDFFFVGGSLLVNDYFDRCIKTIKENCSVPVVLFPGNSLQISYSADAILFLSLISGRNAEMLIGRHVVAAPYLKASSLEVLSTGYMLIESGQPTAVSYMSNTTPIPANKNDIAICTAIAGELLGLKLIFMDAGSGAKQPICKEMISDVSKSIAIPLIVGGGISTPEKAMEDCQAGANIIVVGNSIEKDQTLIHRISEAVHSI